MKKLIFFITLHKDDEKNGFYIYKYSDKYSNRNDPFNEIINFSSTKGKICNKKFIYKNISNNGIIDHPKNDGFFSEWMFNRGVPLCACIEIPDKIKLKNRINIVSELIDYIIRIKL